MSNVPEMIVLAWRLYSAKVASNLLSPDNEKMMQLQLANIFQTLAPLYESSSAESYKILLEVPVPINGKKKIIDIVIEHSLLDITTRTAIELKCFRLFGRHGNGKRGAQNLGMYDYWEDIENIEVYCSHADYTGAYQLTLTDDPYYVETKHTGSQVATYSTGITRSQVTGKLSHEIANRSGQINLRGTYNMGNWKKDGSFYFILQKSDS